MFDEDALSLANVRINKARGCLRSAERELTLGSVDAFKTAANRSYYCIFHAMRAVLALERFDSKKHSGVISEFNKNYVKTGIFPKTLRLANIIRMAFNVRNDSDYDDYYLAPKKDITTQIENAKTFLAAVEEYLSRVAPEALTADINLDDDDERHDCNI